MARHCPKCGKFMAHIEDDLMVLQNKYVKVSRIEKGGLVFIQGYKFVKCPTCKGSGLIMEFKDQEESNTSEDEE